MAAPMRRLVLLFAACSLAAAAWPAHAQSPSPEPQAPAVRLRLVERTTWNGPERQVLEVRFAAVNEGTEPVTDLTIGLTLFGRVRSRTAYERSLVEDPAPVVVVDAETYLREGALEPGATRTFRLSFPLDAPGIDPTTSGIYPLKIDLRSDGVPVAAIRMPVVYLVRPPEQPLALTWTIALHHPISFRPDGVFTSTSLEEAIGPDGSLGRLIDALAAIQAAEPTPVDLAVSPTLLLQLARMRDGYRIEEGGATRQVAPGEGGAARAGAVLATLRELAASPAVEVSAMPYAAAEIPSLLAGGLARDLDLQLERGRELTRSLLGVEPSTDILRPPGGAVDEAALEELAARGVRTVLLDAGAVAPPPQPLGFAPPPTERIGPRGELVAVVPDPSVAAILASAVVTEDPVLAAHAVLGELAAIWQEQPGIARGIALLWPESFAPPGRFAEALVAGLADAPWLTPARARDLASTFPPAEARPLLATAPRTFPPSYVADLKQARRRIEVSRSMLVEPSEEPDRLEDLLLLAESGAFLADPLAGSAFIRAADQAAAAVLGAVRVDRGQVVTLTAQTGVTLPIRIANAATQPLRVVVFLPDTYLVRPIRREILLEPDSEQTLTFEVDLKTTGRFRVVVQVLAPAGRVVDETEVIVRSTAYNRIALLITVAAALVLVLVWARRFLPRRTT
jgi:hypothetical protein